MIAAGRLGANGELRKTQTGDSVLSFSVAVDNGKDKNGEKRPATWLRCAIWGKRGETLEEFMQKGRSVTVTGRPKASAYEDKGRLELMVNESSHNIKIPKSINKKIWKFDFTKFIFFNANQNT